MKLFKIAAVSALLLAAGCGSKEAAGPSGEYTGTAKGFGGDVTVTLTLDNGRITKAEIAGDQETPDVGGAAMEELAKALADKGSAEIDGISGATFTSNAVIEAAEAALAEANK